MKNIKLVSLLLITAGLFPQLSHATDASAQQAAQYFAGLDAPATNDKAHALFQKQARYAWQGYEKNIGQPLLKWSKQEIGYAGDGTVFYPFSGPDFLTAARVYPDASRYVLIAIQKAKHPPYPDALSPEQRATLVRKLGTAWQKFGTLGFFRTDDLNEDQGDKEVSLGVTTELMAFAARLGYEVIDLAPLQFDPGKEEWAPQASGDASWKSVRLTLKRDGKEVTLDYICMDLSDDGVKANKSQRAWLKRMASHPTLLKAASHLLQEPYFTQLRDMVVKSAPIVVQDETGLEYGDLLKVGPVQLYGYFKKPHALFKKTVQPALAEAYKTSTTTRPLPFAYSYLKDTSARSMQIARRQAAEAASQNNAEQTHPPSH